MKTLKICLAVTAAAVLLASSAFAQDVVQVVKPTWWSELANTTIGILAGVLAAAVPVVGLALRTLIANKSRVAGALFDKVLADKLNAGAIAYIRAAEEKLKEKLPPVSAKAEATATAAPATIAEKADIIKVAQPKFEEGFKESLQHFGKKGEAVTDFLRARVEEALAKPVVAPAVVLNSRDPRAPRA